MEECFSHFHFDWCSHFLSQDSVKEQNERKTDRVNNCKIGDENILRSICHQKIQLDWEQFKKATVEIIQSQWVEIKVGFIVLIVFSVTVLQNHYVLENAFLWNSSHKRFQLQTLYWQIMVLKSLELKWHFINIISSLLKHFIVNNWMRIKIFHCESGGRKEKHANLKQQQWAQWSSFN